MSNWSYATIQDEGIAKREAERVEREKGCQPLDFTLTPQERDKALIAVLEKEAYVRSFGRDTSGLEVGCVAPSELTNSERAAFGMGG